MTTTGTIVLINTAPQVPHAPAVTRECRPALPEPDDLLDAMSADGVIGTMAIWGSNVDVEAMRNPRLRGKGAVTVFGRQVRSPRDLAYQILAAADYIEKETA